MNRQDNVIEYQGEILHMLEICRNSGVIFEAMDTQDNLFSMRLAYVHANPDAARWDAYPNKIPSILVQFRLSQTGASEMRTDGACTFSFLNDGIIYSFTAVVLEIDPRSLLFTYGLENHLYIHKTRRSVRLTLEGLDSVSAAIGNKTFGLVNISLGGVGIKIDEPDLFGIGQELPVRLVSGNRVLEATGCVRHVAPLSDNGYVCGLSIAYRDNKSLKHVRQFIEQTRQNQTHRLNTPIAVP